MKHHFSSSQILPTQGKTIRRNMSISVKLICMGVNRGGGGGRNGGGGGVDTSPHKFSGGCMIIHWNDNPFFMWALRRCVDFYFISYFLLACHRGWWCTRIPLPRPKTLEEGKKCRSTPPAPPPPAHPMNLCKIWDYTINLQKNCNGRRSLSFTTRNYILLYK